MADLTDFPAFSISAGVGTARVFTASAAVIAAAEAASPNTSAIETAAYYGRVGVDASFSAARLLAASIIVIAAAKAASPNPSAIETAAYCGRVGFSTAISFAARGSFNVVGRWSNMVAVVGIEKARPEA